jgi:DNA polymerase III subunit delta'
MSRSERDDDIEPVHPRETTAFFGHRTAERALLDAYRSGRVPHAFLIGGPPGIGKATLAYRFARFALAHPDPTAPAVQKAETLALDPYHPVVQRVAAQAHTDLLALERVVNENTGKLYTVIRVEDVRRSVTFFGSTAGEGGWRVCIVDTADELQYPQASNALLKVLEEPPPRALLLLVSHAPQRLLATIRSRCRRLNLRPLDAADVARAVAAATGRDAQDPRIDAAAAAAEGSVAHALALLTGETLAIRERVAGMLDALPQVDPRALHALGDAIAGTAPEPLETFVDTVNAWLSARLGDGGEGPARLVRLAEAWDAVNSAARDVDTYNLERKPFVFSTFGLLAEAARG